MSLSNSHKWSSCGPHLITCWSMTTQGARKLVTALEGAGSELVPVFGGNLVDAIWEDAPPAPTVRRLPPLTAVRCASKAYRQNASL